MNGSVSNEIEYLNYLALKICDSKIIIKLIFGLSEYIMDKTFTWYNINIASLKNMK